jgi:hypothetical protein
MTIKLETIDCKSIKGSSFLTTEGECIDLGFLAPMLATAGSRDMFFPKSIYVRKEMCEVFKELIKSDRKRKQIMIGSPGVGKSILLFLVALYRTLYEDKPGCFIRKARDSEELTSAFL